mgnify:CR=1 FL=1
MPSSSSSSSTLSSSMNDNSLNKKKEAASEKARLKAEYRKIMNEAGGTRKVEAEKVSSNNDVLIDTAIEKKAKRKERMEESIDVKVGDRVKAKFDDGDWYEGTVSSVKIGKVGGVVRVEIDYDDNTTETCRWPDKDIVLLGREVEGGKEKKRLKRGNLRVDMT